MGDYLGGFEGDGFLFVIFQLLLSCTKSCEEKSYLHCGGGKKSAHTHFIFDYYIFLDLFYVSSYITV